MGNLGILYLDKHKDRALHKALSKHGEVLLAGDINEALFLMAEHDFDYYFIDADVPQALAFLKHLRHDPQLMQPKGVVLLTENDEEDCDAWVVDDFLNRRTAVEDLPYIFSHLRGDPPEPSRILRIARLEPALKEPELTADSDPTIPPDDDTAPELDIREHITGHRPERRCDPVTDPAPVEVLAAPGPHLARLAVVGLIVIALAAWLFIWGPLNSRSQKPAAKKNNQKGVHASSTRTANRRQTVPAGYATQTTPTPAQTQTAPAAAISPTGVEADAINTPAQVETPQADQTPAAPPVQTNHAPSVSISGPGQVMHGQPAAFAASASDPDGDPVSLSWTSKTMCWSAPGLYSISVSGTDSRGASSGDTLSVRVI